MSRHSCEKRRRGESVSGLRCSRRRRGGAEIWGVKRETPAELGEVPCKQVDTVLQIFKRLGEDAPWGDSSTQMVFETDREVPKGEGGGGGRKGLCWRVETTAQGPEESCGSGQAPSGHLAMFLDHFQFLRKEVFF